MPRALLLRHRSRDAADAATGPVALISRARDSSPGAGARLLILLIDAYRSLVSPWLPRACRFTPTCSQYARQAVERYGIWRGAWLALRRLGRCHPFHPGGHDPLV